MVDADAATRRERVTVPQVLAVAPLLAVFAVTLVVVAGWVAGAAPFWPTTRLTLSEAILTRDAAEAVRLIEREGADPNRRWPVRAGLIDEPAALTPLEAAVMIRRSDLLSLLLRHGATLPDGDARAALICLGVRSSAGEIVEFLLTTGDKTDPREACLRGRSSY